MTPNYALWELAQLENTSIKCKFTPKDDSELKSFSGEILHLNPLWVTENNNEWALGVNFGNTQIFKDTGVMVISESDVVIL